MRSQTFKTHNLTNLEIFFGNNFEKNKIGMPFPWRVTKYIIQGIGRLGCCDSYEFVWDYVNCWQFEIVLTISFCSIMQVGEVERLI